jgi:hypothetical protein
MFNSIYWYAIMFSVQKEMCIVRIMFNGLMRITERNIHSFENMTDAQEFFIANS